MIYLLIALYISIGLAIIFFSTKKGKELSLNFKNFSDDPFYRKLHPFIGAFYVGAMAMLFFIAIILLASLWPILLLLYITIKFSIFNIDRIKEKKDQNFSKILFKHFVLIPAQANPLGLDPKWVFYVEPEYNDLINKYIIKHYEEVCKEVGYKGCDFVYFPYASKKLLSDIFSDSYMHYNFPQLSNNDIKQFRERIPNLTTADFSRFLMQGIGYTGELECGFLRKSADPEIRYQKLKPTSKKQLKQMTESYINNIGERNQCFYRMAKGNPEDSSDIADWSFSTKASELAQEISQKMEMLKALGYEQMLVSLFNVSKEVVPEQFSRLSKLHITNDYRIFLPDFQNLEIILTPLQKAVFILFIRHPEGIVLKFLSDYREELMEIYKTISLRESIDDITASIDELVNPTKNSINEKCSRIKEAFVKHFSDRIARHYYITGERGRPKMIMLDRNMVKWEGDEILMFTNSRTNEEIMQLEKTISSSYRAGVECNNQKDFFAAIEHFSKTIALSPYHSNAYFSRAFAFASIGNYAESEKDNTAAIEINNEINASYHNRAEDRLFLGKLQEALEDINQYLSIKPKCQESYFLRGLIYEKLNEHQLTCQDWFTSKHLGREGMDDYLNKYPDIKVTKPKFFASKANVV